MNIDSIRSISAGAANRIERPKNDEKVKEVKREETKEVATDRRIEDKYNDMKISERKIESTNEAKVKADEVKEELKDKESLKVMDRVDNIRDKVLTTLSQ